MQVREETCKENDDQQRMMMCSAGLTEVILFATVSFVWKVLRL